MEHKRENISHNYHCVKRYFNSEETVRIKEIPTRPLLFLFLDKTIARMPTTIPCRDKTDKV